MKKSFLYTKFLLGLVFLSASSHAAAADFNEQRLLKALDSICGDSWCEGTFDFHFQKVQLKPEKNETQFFFRMSQNTPIRMEPALDQGFKAQINQRFYDVSCVIPGVAEYEGLLQSEFFLRRDVYQSLTACIRSLEDQLTKVTQLN